MGFFPISHPCVWLSVQSYLHISKCLVVFPIPHRCLSNPTSCVLRSSQPSMGVTQGLWHWPISLRVWWQNIFYKTCRVVGAAFSSERWPWQCTWGWGLLFSESSLQEGREVQRKSSQPLSALLHKFLKAARANALEVYFHQMGCLSKLIAESEVLNALLYFQNHPLRVLGSEPVLPIS